MIAFTDPGSSEEPGVIVRRQFPLPSAYRPVNRTTGSVVNKRVKALGERFDVGVGDHWAVFGRLPYPPLGVFVQFSDIPLYFLRQSVLPGKRAVSSTIEQLIYDRVPRCDFHARLIRLLPKPTTHDACRGLKFSDHDNVAGNIRRSTAHLAYHEKAADATGKPTSQRSWRSAGRQEIALL